MNRPGHLSIASAFVLMSATLFDAGCRVSHEGKGDKDNVNIATPFGGMSVKTDSAEVQGALGLSQYPGAVLEVKKRGDHDDGSADVNLNFGSFHLGVKAASYTTPDAPEKVLAFYRKDMAAHLGTVILCNGSVPVGKPTQTPDGLTCDDSKRDNVHLDSDGNRGELKAGSKLHQHIVSVDARGTGTKFSLVSLDLPKGLERDSDDKQ